LEKALALLFFKPMGSIGTAAGLLEPWQPVGSYVIRRIAALQQAR